jgi:hypothetical protein
VYVKSPAAEDYETLGVYVPGAYLSVTQHGDGSNTATIKADGKVGTYTAATAPIVFPVNTPGYAAQKPPTSYSYSDVEAYVKAGFVYVFPGLRGQDSETSTYTGNAPWGVTDLKAAVRYIRYNADVVPGDKERMVVFGMSGGGAQSSVMGASGDSALYTPYLESIGAAMKDSTGTEISDAVAGVMAWCPITNLDYANAAYEWNMGQFASTGTEISDAVAGVMAWCPITNLDYANAAYEWNMGQFASTGTRAPGTWTAAYSADLASAFAAYQNKLAVKDASGRTLALEKSADGSFLAGSYYDHLMAVVETSLNDFLSDTKFPYTPSNAMMPGMGGTGGPPSGAKLPKGGLPAGGGMPSGGAGGASSSSTTYKTVQAYIAHLNSGTTWVVYDAKKNTAKVLGLQGFVKSQKTATKDVGAFDGVSRNATENLVHGLGKDPLHYSPVSREVIAANQGSYKSATGWRSTYGASQYAVDAARTDKVGKAVAFRVNMYNPLYYLSPFYAGHKTSTVAPHWRIRTGIMQPDTANTTEINLVLALQNYGIEKVDFATVWGLAHTMAERTGDPVANFITWVEQSVTQ